MQPHPGAEAAEFAREIDKFRPHLAVAKRAFRIAQVQSVSAGVLRNDEQFLDAGGDELFGLAEHVGGWARDEIAAQARNDAERAAVVAALGNLQIGVMPGCELDALCRHEIEERIVRRRDRLMDGADDAFVGLRAAD